MLSVAFTPILSPLWKYKLWLTNSHNTVIEQEETPGSKHSRQGNMQLLSIRPFQTNAERLPDPRVVVRKPYS